MLEIFIKKTVIDKWNGFYNYKSDKQKSFMLSGKVIIIHLKCELKKKRHCMNQNLKDDLILL